MGLFNVTRTSRVSRYNGLYMSSALRVCMVAPIAVMTLGSPGPAQAQNYSFSNFRVEGNERIQTSTILTYVGIEPGSSVSAGQLNDAYRRVIDSGIFETVEFVPQGGTLLIRVEEYPTINRISFEGNRRLKDDDLAELVTSDERRVFDPAQAEADATIIAEAYSQTGRIGAVVTPRIIRRSDNRVDLCGRG